jgi:hypothetical protein
LRGHIGADPPRLLSGQDASHRRARHNADSRADWTAHNSAYDSTARDPGGKPGPESVWQAPNARASSERAKALFRG